MTQIRIDQMKFELSQLKYAELSEVIRTTPDPVLNGLAKQDRLRRRLGFYRMMMPDPNRPSRRDYELTTQGYETFCRACEAYEGTQAYREYEQLTYRRAMETIEIDDLDLDQFFS